LATVGGATAARKRTLDSVKLAHANASFDRAADGCDFGYFDGAALCATSTAERRQVKNDARNLVGIIGGDRTKTRTYCKMMDVSWQMNEAAREKGQKKRAKTLSEEMVQLGKRLPEFVVLSDILEQLDLNSPDGQEIALIIQSLNQFCPE
jgi:hypothetical protein